jgi:hypothetical protein
MSDSDEVRGMDGKDGGGEGSDCVMLQEKVMLDDEVRWLLGKVAARRENNGGSDGRVWTRCTNWRTSCKGGVWLWCLL